MSARRRLRVGLALGSGSAHVGVSVPWNKPGSGRIFNVSSQIQ